MARVPWQSASSSACAPITMAVLPVHFSIGMSGFEGLSCARSNELHIPATITDSLAKTCALMFAPPLTVATEMSRQRKRHDVVALLRPQLPVSPGGDHKILLAIQREGHRCGFPARREIVTHTFPPLV